jgi:hypothetical protein
VPPKFLPTTGKRILFLDELTAAPQMTQAGCYQLVLDRKLGEYVLPDGWVVIRVSQVRDDIPQFEALRKLAVRTKGHGDQFREADLMSALVFPRRAGWQSFTS